MRACVRAWVFWCWSVAAMCITIQTITTLHYAFIQMIKRRNNWKRLSPLPPSRARALSFRVPSIGTIDAGSTWHWRELRCARLINLPSLLSFPSIVRIFRPHDDFFSSFRPLTLIFTTFSFFIVCACIYVCMRVRMRARVRIIAGVHGSC